MAFPVGADIVETVRLVQAAPEGFDIVLHPGARVDVTGVSNGVAHIRVDTYQIADEVPVHDDQHGWTTRASRGTDSGLLGDVPAASIGRLLTFATDMKVEPDVSPRCSRIGASEVSGVLAVNHERLLVAEPRSLDIALETNGGSIEILEERDFDGHRFQRVRQLTDGVEVRAWTATPIKYAWGNHRCRSRAVFIHPPEFERLPDRNLTRRPERYKIFGQELSEARPVASQRNTEQREYELWEQAMGSYAPPALPSSFLRVDPTKIRAVISDVRESSTLYGIVLIDDAPVCATHHVTDRSITIDAEEQTEEGLVRETRTYSTYLSDLGGLSMDGPKVVRSVDGVASNPVYFRCTSSFRVVGADEESFHIFSGAYPVVGYHPDDATRWYKSESACKAALVRAPRLISNKPEVRLAGEGLPLRGGC